MAGLLVSVRSAEEARAALAGGATVIDVKEPSRGPLGRADVATWRAVREALPGGVALSVALGELAEATTEDQVGGKDFEGLCYRKLGLAGAGPHWGERWSTLRRAWGPGPAWIAVAYADWRKAAAPPPEVVLDAARDASCAGVLVDTWDKGQPSPLDGSWVPWVDRARRLGLQVALAGGLDELAIRRVAFLRPDLIAVRGAACERGNRLGPIDPGRVAHLAALVARL